MENRNGKSIRFVISGAGHIGNRHIDILQSLPNAKVVAVIDIDPAKKAAVGDIPFFTSIDSYLNEGPPADVATICTPNGLHAPHALSFIMQKMHVLIEKPMALTRADSLQLLQEAERQNRKVFCVLQNRYTPTSKWVKKIVEDQLLGEVFMVQANCFWNRDHRYYRNGSWRGTTNLDGGTLYTQFSHFVDLVYWLFGDWKDIDPVFYNYNHKHLTEFEDSGIVNFRLGGGAMGTFNFTTATWQKNMESSLTIIGENGSLKVGGQYMDRVEYCHINNYQQPEISPSNPPNKYDGFQGSASNHLQVFNNVIKALSGQDYEITEGKTAAEVVSLIEKIYAAGNRRIKPAIKAAAVPDSQQA